MDKKLQICATIKDGFALGLVNFLSLIAATLLYVLTIWIPYLNVGTTIAMCSLPAEMAKGKVIDPLFIFDGKYRRNMGEFFILMTLMSGAICFGFAFGVIPGFVISIAWNFAVILFVDKDKDALESLRESNRITYGNKWRIFWIYFLLLTVIYIAIGAIYGIFCYLFKLEILGLIICILLAIFIIPALIGADASMYRQLTTGKFLGDKEAPKAQEAKIAEPKAEVKEAPKAEPKAEKPAPKAAPKKAAPKKAAPKAEKEPKAAPKKEAAPKKAAPKAKKAAPKAEKK